MTTASTPIIPDYAQPTAAGGFVTQTRALFVDAYRELNAKKLFWIVLILSVVVVAGFATMGINERGVTLFKLEFPGAWNTNLITKGEFYKMLFVIFAIPIWLAWLATILAIISTSSIFPDMLSGGSIDLYLAKPIARLRLFLTKYITGLTFVTLQVAGFSITAFFVIGIRGGSWEPGLFLAIPIMVLFFSYLFSVCVLLGVLTRSTIAAMLLTLLIWLFFWAAHTSEQTIHLFRITAEVRQEKLAKVIARNDADIARYREQAQPATTQTAQPAASTQPATAPSGAGVEGLIRNIEFQRDATIKQKEDAVGTLKNLQLADRIAHGVNVFVPKTTQTVDLLRRSLVNAAHLPGQYDEEERNNNRRGGRNRDNDFNPGDPEVQKRLRRDIDSTSPMYVIGTSIGFELVILALGAWIFCRRDF